MKKLLVLLIVSLTVVTSPAVGLAFASDDPDIIAIVPDQDSSTARPLESLLVDPQPTLLDRLSQRSTLVAVDSLPVKVGRTMTVIFEPFRPRPSDEVSAVISGRSSVLSLTPGEIAVDINGNFITVDIHWLGAVLKTLAASASLDSAPAQGQSCSGGIVYDQIPGDFATGRLSDEFEIVQPLGTFSPGMYTVEVNSLGMLTGTVTGTFTVYQPGPSALALPDPWSFLHDSGMWFGF